MTGQKNDPLSEAVKRNQCGKAVFHTQEMAETRLREIAEHPRSEVYPTRAYQCPLCGFWHLTAAEKKCVTTSCGRLGYFKKADALAGLRKIRENAQPGRAVPDKITGCAKCGFWHLGDAPRVMGQPRG